MIYQRLCHFSHHCFTHYIASLIKLQKRFWMLENSSCTGFWIHPNLIFWPYARDETLLSRPRHARNLARLGRVMIFFLKKKKKKKKCVLVDAKSRKANKGKWKGIEIKISIIRRKTKRIYFIDLLLASFCVSNIKHGIRHLCASFPRLGRRIWLVVHIPRPSQTVEIGSPRVVARNLRTRLCAPCQNRWFFKASFTIMVNTLVNFLLSGC